MPDVPYVTNVFNITKGVSQADVDSLHAKLDTLIAQGAHVMSDLTQIDQSVSDAETRIAAVEGTEASAAALLAEISALLRANATDPAAIAALADRLDTAGEGLDTSNAALAAAVAANDPNAPAPEPTP